jgi:predicted transporter
VDINVNNLSDYYKLVKQHTDKSFLASITAGAIGFVLIITGLLIGFADFENSKSVAYISAGSGVIIEFISGVFFYLYNKTTIQLKGYHDSLVNIQNVLLSFKVIEDTTDPASKLDMAKSMIATLIGESSG